MTVIKPYFFWVVLTEGEAQPNEQKPYKLKSILCIIIRLV